MKKLILRWFFTLEIMLSFFLFGGLQASSIYRTVDGDSTKNWTASSGSTNFLMVDDPATADDGDSTYVSTSSLNTRDFYNMDDVSDSIPPGSTICSVLVYIRAKKDDTNTHNITVGGQSGASLFGFTSAITSNASYLLNFDLTRTVDPDTSAAWTIAALDSLVIGFQTTGANWPTGARISLCACQVIYENPPNTKKWCGGQSADPNDPNTAGNWDPPNVPTNTEQAWFGVTTDVAHFNGAMNHNYGTFAIVTGAAVTFDDASAEVNVVGKVTIDGSLLINTGEFDVEGIFSASNTADISMAGGDFYSSDHMYFLASATFTTMTGGSMHRDTGTSKDMEFDNNGTIYKLEIDGGSHTLKDSIRIKNNLAIDGGELDVDQNLTITMEASSVINVVGTLDLNGASGNITTITSPTPGTDQYNFTVNSGGDLHATFANINSMLNTGLLFLDDSRMGGNTTNSSGSVNFRNVTFNNILSGGLGIDLSALDGDEGNNFPQILRDIKFNGTAGNNVKAGANTPQIEFFVTSGNYGSIATDGETGDDDVVPAKLIWNAPANYASVGYFKACGIEGSDGVRLTWGTLLEVFNLGFNLYRSNEKDGEYVKINESLILPEAEQGSGADYEYIDPIPLASGSKYYYKLGDVEVSSKETFHGPICSDMDCDGIPDDWEELHGLNPHDPSDALLDDDEDGLSNLEEYELGFNPQSADSDGDGIPDSEDKPDPPDVLGFLAGKDGIEVISSDPFGMTIEICPQDLIQEKVTVSHSGWLYPEGDEKSSYQQYKEETYLRVRFGNLPEAYASEIGHPQVQVVSALAEVPFGKKIVVRVIKEELGPEQYLLHHVLPVPHYESRSIPVVKPGSESKAKKKLKRFKRKKVGYARRKELWGSLFGGSKSLEGEEESDDQFSSGSSGESSSYGSQAGSEAQGLGESVPGSQIVEFYGKDYEVYTSAAYWPEETIELGGKSLAAGKPAQSVKFYPFQYNAHKKTIRPLKKLRVRLDYEVDTNTDEYQKTLAEYQEHYLNKEKPAYLDASIPEKFEIKIRKPDYSSEGDLNDRTLYKLTLADLESTGCDVSSIRENPEYFHLYQGFAELSLKEVYQDNEIDHFLFYADSGANETVYNDKVTSYGFYDESSEGNRWGEVLSEASYDQELTSFRQRIRYEANRESTEYNYLHEGATDSVFVHKKLINGTGSQTYPFDTPGISSFGEVNVATRLWSSFNQEPDYDQGVYLTLNSEVSPYSSPQWMGHRYHTDKSLLQSNQFNEANALKIEGYKPVGITGVRARMDFIEVDYPRDLKAHNEELLITTNRSGISRYDVGGFADVSEITVLDVSDVSAVREISGVEKDTVTQRIQFNHRNEGPKDSVLYANFLRLDTDFGPEDANGRGNVGFGYATGSPKLAEEYADSKPLDYYKDYWELTGTEPEEGLRHKGVRLLLIRETDAQSIYSIKKVLDASHVRGKTSQVDHLLIVDETLKTESVRLETHLQSQGQVVELVTFQDLMQAYTFAEYTSSAAKDYIEERYLTAEGEKPRYVTLVGSGNINTKGTWDFPTEKPLIPSVLVRGGLKVSASDWPLVQVTGDVYPDLSIGRLDASGEEELGDILDKVIGYDQSATPSELKAVLLADHDPGFDDEIFEGAIIEFMGYLADLEIEGKYFSKNDYPSYNPLTDGMVNSIHQENVGLVFYNGHGNIREWGKSTFFSHVDLKQQFQPGHWLPVVIEANCLSSDYFHAAFRSLGTHWLQGVNRGAVGVIGTTSRTSVSAKDEVFRALGKKLLVEGFSRLGPALQRAKIEAFTSNPKDFFRAIATQHLLGVPSMKVKGVPSIENQN